MRSLAVVAAFSLLAAFNPAPPAAVGAQQWSFSDIDRIEISGVSGNVSVLAANGTEVELELEHDVRPAGAMTTDVDQEGSTLVVRERWGRGSGRGSVSWTLRVPATLEPTISIETASGGLDADDVAARYRFESASGSVVLRGGSVADGSTFETASGDLRLSDVTVGDDVDMSTASGEVELSGVRAGAGFEFSTASGNVTIERSNGVLEGSSASGNVRVYDTGLDGPSRFSSASGNVVVRLERMPQFDLEAASASGNVRLETASLDGDYTLVLTAREDHGRIRSDLEYTSETTFERGGRTYEEKTIRSGTGEAEIRLRTASGTVEVREG